MTFHPTFARFQDAKALILVNRSRHDGGLLAHHAFADDFRINAVADGIVDKPAASEELRCHHSHILDANEIGKDVVALRWLRVIAQIDGPHCDANAFRFSVEEAASGHLCNLVTEPKRAPLALKNERGAG
jgi:hypothetical protein